MTSDAGTPQGDIEAAVADQEMPGQTLGGYLKAPWPRFTDKQEVWAFWVGSIISNLVALGAAVGLIAASRVDGLETLQYVRFVVAVAGVVALLAALMRVVAHRRSEWLDFWGKLLGLAAAVLTFGVVLRGGDVWPF